MMICLPFFECPVADALGNAVCFEIDDRPPFSVRTVHAQSFTSFPAHSQRYVCQQTLVMLSYPCAGRHRIGARRTDHHHRDRCQKPFRRLPAALTAHSADPDSRFPAKTPE